MKRVVFILIILLLWTNQVMITKANGKGEGQKVPDFQFIVHVLPGQEQIDFELILKNNEKHPISFEFPTSQKYEITLYDQSGQEIYRYSKDRAFLQMIQPLTIKPESAVTWSESWDYTVKGKRVKAGDYKVVAQLQALKADGVNIQASKQSTSIINTTIPEKNPVFRHITVSGEKGEYTVTGEARFMNKSLFYTVEDGHDQLIDETKLTPKKKQDTEWEKFKLQLSIRKESIQKNTTLLLFLYERDPKTKAIINTYPVVLERFL
ncbi:hypothetical protein K6959_03925 [Bacillus aquiflavi]|uniref:BsuPI-related putative proteinase inhibitor n=1 Tax=Bacillus aquiflavi TaxID=2672567 RepID=UPI001CA9D533|nr:BsuPI-related putative proteinase inhibitor [Bacillus aquiflavi]UAC49057.1 hypothetical protein K6959_03925 [Bacillus aquiflavi]